MTKQYPSQDYEKCKCSYVNQARIHFINWKWFRVAFDNLKHGVRRWTRTVPESRPSSMRKLTNRVTARSWWGVYLPKDSTASTGYGCRRAPLWDCGRMIISPWSCQLSPHCKKKNCWNYNNNKNLQQIALIKLSKYRFFPNYVMKRRIY